jgi:hypothetical protein
MRRPSRGAILAAKEAAMTRWTRRAVLASALALAACSTRRPRLADTYGDVRRPGNRPPLILVPGAFGSSLRDRRTGIEVWPASDTRLLLGNYRGLELPLDHSTLEPLDDGIEPYAIFREGLGRDFYGEILRTLQQAGGYRLCRPGREPTADADLFLLLYDFRRDNLRAVAALDALIERIRTAYGDPALQVDVLAHSNGGLLARYYARYGTAPLSESGSFEPTFRGAERIARLLLVGTPNLGTLQPVLSLLRGEEIGLRNIPAEVVATCTGLAQMMPHPHVPWLVNHDGTRLEADLFDADTWREFRWGLWDPQIAERAIARHGGGADGRRYLDVLREYLRKHLRRGRRFMESLAVPAATGAEPPAWLFGGDCERTVSRLVVESVGGVLHARERVEDIVAPDPRVDYEAAMSEPGDTVVTRSSLLGQVSAWPGPAKPALGTVRLRQVTFLCERHQQLSGNPTVLDNVLHALFTADGTAPAGA